MPNLFRHTLCFTLLLNCGLWPAQLGIIQKTDAPAALDLFLMQAILPGNQTAISSCAGPGKTFYACAINAKELAFQKSLDSGKTWLPEKKIIAPIANGSSTAAINYCEPSIACDLSNGPYNRRIYVCWSDIKNGVKNPDVFLVYSEDGGASWTEPILVTYHPNHKAQYDPALALDKNGRVYLSYFDQQNYLEGPGADLYLALSDNGGLLFSYYKVEKRPANTPAINLGILAEGSNAIELRWVVLKSAVKAEKFTAFINDSLLTVYNKLNAEQEPVMEKTFAFADQVKVPVILQTGGLVSAAITKPLEPGFEKVVFKNKKLPKGHNELLIDTKRLGLQKGNYTLTLYYEGKNSFAWILDQ